MYFPQVSTLQIKHDDSDTRKTEKEQKKKVFFNLTDEFYRGQ